MKKMGESQIIDFFSGYLRDLLHDEYGKSVSYTIGNFSGSQDRKFADFFAGTKSHNILIEFKEKKQEYKAEIKKPLRENLCATLNNKVAQVSRLCHFIGWGKDQVGTQVELNAYIDLICTLWGANNYLQTTHNYEHETFSLHFINGDVGVDHRTFMDYIEHLNKIAGGCATGSEVPFRSMLYSKNDRGRLIGTRFENLKQLNVLRAIDPPEPSWSLSP